MAFRPQTPTVIAVGAVLAATVVLLSYPGGMVAAYEDATCQACDANEGTRPRVNFEALSVSLANRIALKDDLVHELTAGRTTLAEVTARFLDMNAIMPGTAEVLAAKYPDLSSRERTARNVIDYVASQDLPEKELNAVLERLKDEYQRTYNRRPTP